MRLIGLLLLGSLSGTVFAANAPIPPVVDKIDQDPALEPQVTITKEKDTVVEEFRAHGKLYMIKVTPKIGKPYYLIDEQGDGMFSRQDGLDASKMRPPRWVIFSF